MDARICPRCDETNRPEARFCDGCRALCLYRELGARGHAKQLVSFE